MVVISAVVAVVVVAIVTGVCYRWLVLRSPVVCFYFFFVLLVWLWMLLWLLLSLLLLHHCDTGSGLPFCIHVL